MLPHNNVINKMEPTRIGKVTQYCLVCGDKSTGLHYGVLTCEGCKAFFRRTHKRDPNSFTCFKDSKCMITRRNRIDCQACRLKKCRDVGMATPTKVRVPKSLHLKIVHIPQPALATVSQQIGQLHTETYGYSSEKMRSMVVKDFEIKTPLKAHQRFINEINIDMKSFASFIRRLPQLNGIVPDDKGILIRKHAFSIYLIRSTPAYTHNGFVFQDGRLIRWEKFLEAHGLLGMRINTFARNFQKMNFTEPEIAVFLLLTIFQPPISEGEGFQNLPLLTENYKLFTEILKYQLTARDQENRLFEKIPGLLAEVNTINDLYKQVIESIKRNISQLFIPSLFADVFGVLETKTDNQPAE